MQFVVLSNKRLHPTTGPVTTRAFARPAPDPVAGEPNVMSTKNFMVTGKLLDQIGIRHKSCQKVALSWLLFTTTLLVVLGGCSGYRPTKYGVVDPGGVATVEVSGDTYRDSELSGKTCRLKLNNGKKIQGKIIGVSEKGFILTAEMADSPLQGQKNVELEVNKRDIVEFEILANSTERTMGLFVGVVVVLAIINWVQNAASGVAGN